jgi:hypothetical protein
MFEILSESKDSLFWMLNLCKTSQEQGRVCQVGRLSPVTSSKTSVGISLSGPYGEQIRQISRTCSFLTSF